MGVNTKIFDYRCSKPDSYINVKALFYNGAEIVFVYNPYTQEWSLTGTGGFYEASKVVDASALLGLSADFFWDELSSELDRIKKTEGL